jgi:hypothetical protein
MVEMTAIERGTTCGEEFGGEGACRGREIGDSLGCEGPADQRSELGVARRIHLDEHRVDCLRIPFEGDATGRREGVPVVDGATDIVVARQRPEAALGVDVRGRVVPQRSVDRVRILMRLVRIRIKKDWLPGLGPSGQAARAPVRERGLR